MVESQCVIVGAGFAGAATAYQLCRRGLTDLVVLEREATAGMHSSGRSAAMVRQVVSDAELLPLARDGARFIREARELWSQPDLFCPCGSLLLASGSAWRGLLGDLDRAGQAGIEGSVWTRGEVERRVEAARGGDFSGAVCVPGDGTVDAHALLQGYLREARRAGARILCSTTASSVSVEKGGVVGLRAGDLEIRTPRIVNAGGAWACELAAMAGASPLPLVPLRRHLVYTGPYAKASRDWPFVWNVEHEVYFRPESAGLLLSPCDEAPSAPCAPDPDPQALELLSRKLGRAFPRLVDIPVARTWAGLRTFAPDRRFVIGPDPLVRGFFWVAGLGGHGVTTSAAVGALAAEAVLGARADTKSPFSPARFSAEHSPPPQPQPGDTVS